MYYKCIIRVWGGLIGNLKYGSNESFVKFLFEIHNGAHITLNAMPMDKMIQGTQNGRLKASERESFQTSFLIEILKKEDTLIRLFTTGSAS